jgi:hypothetical protein
VRIREGPEFGKRSILAFASGQKRLIRGMEFVCRWNRGRYLIGRRDKAWARSCTIDKTMEVRDGL